MNASHTAKILNEAFTTYFGWDTTCTAQANRSKRKTLRQTPIQRLKEMGDNTDDHLA
jgi:hypothetical protein